MKKSEIYSILQMLVIEDRDNLRVSDKMEILRELIIREDVESYAEKQARGGDEA